MVLGVWIIVLAGIGSLAGKFESAEKNESSSFLPGSAESFKVAQGHQASSRAARPPPQ